MNRQASATSSPTKRPIMRNVNSMFTPAVPLNESPNKTAQTPLRQRQMQRRQLFQSEPRVKRSVTDIGQSPVKRRGVLQTRPEHKDNLPAKLFVGMDKPKHDESEKLVDMVHSLQRYVEVMQLEYGKRIADLEKKVNDQAVTINVLKARNR